MLIMYVFLILMLLVALGLLALPFIKNRSLNGFSLLAIMLIIFSMGLYQVSGNKSLLSWWFSEGKQHYQLLTTFEQLGGVDGAIKKIQHKLTDNPNDAQGWFILGKLYLSKGEEGKAQEAFARAKAISAWEVK